MKFKFPKTCTISLALGFLFLSLYLAPCRAQRVITDTIARRDLVIDLGGSLTTDAQLTFPVVGDGPYPGVLLVHGSGSLDMNANIPSPLSGSNDPSKPFLQIAEYLSERGFAVLRYNKRGIGLNSTTLDMNVVQEWTVQALTEDAKKALEVLRNQPEVNGDDVAIIGWSEGTAIAIRIAIEKPTIKSIVLIGAYAQNISEIMYYQIVDRRIMYAEEIDINDDGLLSIEEVYATFDVELVELAPLSPNAMIENSTGEWRWCAGLDADKDGYFGIYEELKPVLLRNLDWFTTAESYWRKWLCSHFALETNLAVVGNVSSSILILQGEGDIQSPFGQAFLLEQRLTELGHPDHTLITYPGLGHSLSPAYGWIQPLGPIQEYALSDLAAWLKDPAREVPRLMSRINDLSAELDLKTDELENASLKISEVEKKLANQTELFNQELETANQEIDNLENQIAEVQSESSNLQNTLTEMETQNSQLQSALELSRNLTYLSLGVTTIAIAIAMRTLRKH
jgi:pimeloyl-ACP methyl ester carboxylesterase